MSKTCPNCGKTAADDVKFCMDCGYRFAEGASKKGSSSLSDGKIFLVIIAVILLAGAAIIFNMGNDSNSSGNAVDDVEHVDLTIKEVSGYESDYDGKTRYTIYTEALFMEVPSDMSGYIVKTSYCDKNGTVLGQETEKLSYVYYDTDYDISFGYYDSYKKLDLDHVNVEIIKGGKTIDNFTANVDKNKIGFYS